MRGGARAFTERPLTVALCSLFCAEAGLFQRLAPEAWEGFMLESSGPPAAVMTTIVCCCLRPCQQKS